ALCKTIIRIGWQDQTAHAAKQLKSVSCKCSRPTTCFANEGSLLAQWSAPTGVRSREDSRRRWLLPGAGSRFHHSFERREKGGVRLGSSRAQPRGLSAPSPGPGWEGQLARGVWRFS